MAKDINPVRAFGAKVANSVAALSADEQKELAALENWQTDAQSYDAAKVKRLKQLQLQAAKSSPLGYVLLGVDAQQPGTKTQTRSFGEKLASNPAHYLPDPATAARQMTVAGLLGALVGGTRGYLDPGYDEKFDEAGNIISRKRRDPLRAALRNAGIGLGVGAASNYAAQVGNNWARENLFTTANAQQ